MFSGNKKTDALVYEDAVRRLWSDGLHEMFAGEARLNVWQTNMRRHKKKERKARRKHAQNVRVLLYRLKRQAKRYRDEKEVPRLEEEEAFPFLD